MHVPCGADHPREKVATLEGIYDALAEQSSIPRVLCGDLDAPQMELLSGTLVTWGERISDDGAVELASQDGRLDQAERNVLVGLAAFDLADVYRRLHGYEPQGYSWYATSGGVLESVPVGRRFAHVFASAVLQPVHCWYLHELREEGFSDHSPLLVDFDV